jgi:large subunit ribosomal protein L25
MDVQVVARVRAKTGKGAARKIRGQDMVPAVFYGPQSEPVPLSIPAARLEKLFREMGEEHRLLSLIIDDGRERQEKHVMIREIQVHPARRQMLHVDLYEVAMDHPIVVDIPVELTGRAAGVERGGLLNLIRRNLAIRCLPGEIPEKIEVDVSSLDIGDAVHVSDLVGVVPFELMDDPTFAVANVVAPEGMAEETGTETGEAG